MCPSVLYVIELVLSDFLVSDSEVFIEALLLRDEMTRGRIRIMNLSGVHEFMVTACTFTQSRVLNQLLIFHCSLYEKV